ncbi:MAG: DUF1287 domain-containing protein [Solobacterium sp.]|nr:DUF1287 domain-containing protein [Solobacterium sp.]
MKTIWIYLCCVLLFTGCGNVFYDIPFYCSETDKDQDGIDDQTDIFQNAKAYIATKPKYKSRYYNTGYPDDGYGTCVDVVGYALKNAGYDLMYLVDEDIQNHPDEYDIDIRDKNIDFRRVRNLKVYFAHNAISLTTDTKQIEEWQPGDIVIYEDHIGIVSDRRNTEGIPYLIHHRSVFQMQYEEDLLEYEKIIGHYRIS